MEIFALCCRSSIVNKRAILFGRRARDVRLIRGSSSFLVLEPSKQG